MYLVWQYMLNKSVVFQNVLIIFKVLRINLSSFLLIKVFNDYILYLNRIKCGKIKKS